MKNIAGIFYNHTDADNAVSSLLKRGFSKDDISILMSEEAKKELFHTPHHTDELAKGGATGAAAGGTLGALMAGLSSIGSIMIPNVGLLASGPIVAALSGAGAGAIVGGLAGALIGVGFANTEARRYEDELRRGNIVLIVRTDNADELLAAVEVLKWHEAVTETV